MLAPRFLSNDIMNWPYFTYIQKNPTEIYNTNHNFNLICYLYDYDYVTMRNIMQFFNEELVQYVFHPKRILKLAEKYNLDFDEVLDIY